MPILVMNRGRQITRTVRCIFVAGLLTTLLLSACSTTKPREASPSPFTEPLLAEFKVESDLRILHTVAGQLDSTRSEFIALHQHGGWQKRGYFDAAEHNQLERFYFRFVVGHTALWEIINSYGGSKSRFTDDEIGIKAHVLAVYASSCCHFIRHL